MNAGREPKREPQSGEGERGVALVAVLWGVLLLSVLAVSFSTRAGTDARLARNALDRAEAASLADAGVYWAVRELLRPPEARRVALDGATYAIAFHGAQLHVRVQDEGGKADLNAAPPELLRHILEAAGAAPGEAVALADAIADWRDSDDRRRAEGAEWADYQAAGLAIAPRNARLLMLEELRGVMGMTPELFAAAAPLLTVHSGTAGIDPFYAPPGVLRALPGMTAGQAEAVAEARQRLARGTMPEAPEAAFLLKGAATAFVASSAGRTFTVRVSVLAPSGARFVRRALVELTGRPSRPYRFLSWSQDHKGLAHGAHAVMKD